MPVSTRSLVLLAAVGGGVWYVSQRSSAGDGNGGGGGGGGGGGDQNQPPVVSISSSHETVEQGVQVEFDGRASSDPDGTVQSYTWDFGDGGTASGALATHMFASPGDYTVTLTVADDMGVTTSDTVTVSVTEMTLSPGHTPPDGALIGSSIPLAVEGNYIWVKSSDGNPANYSLRPSTGINGIDIDASGLDYWVSSDFVTAGGIVPTDSMVTPPGFFFEGGIEEFKHSGNVDVYINGTLVSPDNVTNFL